MFAVIAILSHFLLYRFPAIILITVATRVTISQSFPVLAVKAPLFHFLPYRLPTIKIFTTITTGLNLHQ
jgi:hypothetical protein